MQQSYNVHQYTLNCIGCIQGPCGKKQHPSAIKIKCMQSQLKCQLSTITYRGMMQCKLYENIFPTKYCCVFYANLFNCFHCLECTEPGDEAKFFPQIFKRTLCAYTCEHNRRTLGTHSIHAHVVAILAASQSLENLPQEAYQHYLPTGEKAFHLTSSLALISTIAAYTKGVERNPFLYLRTIFQVPC